MVPFVVLNSGGKTFKLVLKVDKFKQLNSKKSETLNAK
jgi:hypothetical protein